MQQGLVGERGEEVERMSLTEHGVLSINLSFASVFLLGATGMWRLLGDYGVMVIPKHILLASMVLLLLGLLIPPYVCVPGLIKGVRRWKEEGARFCVLLSALGLALYGGMILACILFSGM